MAKGKIITGLDVGTHSIKALVAEKRGQEWNVLSYLQIPSFGLRKGAVVNIDEVAKNIQLLMQRIQNDCGRRINSAFVNIGGSHLRIEPSDGLISVSRADHIISNEDVERVLQATRAVNIPSNEEVLDVFPREFIIDDQKGIKQPTGLSGIRLQAKVLLLCYFQSYFINLTQAVLNTRLQIDDVIPSPLAAARSVLTPQQKEIGVALIDIGAATTSVAVFEEGDLVHLAVFPLGSGNITNDIAIGLRTEITVAEDIKKQYGACILSKSDKTQIVKNLLPKVSEAKSEKQSAERKKIEAPDKSNSLFFTKKNLVGIIEPRVFEILNLIQKELKSIGVAELLPGGIVLTGGGAKLPKLKDLVKQQLRLPCQIGIPKGIIGLLEDPGLATVSGLVLGGAEFQAAENEGVFNFIKGFGSGLKRIFKNFMP